MPSLLPGYEYDIFISYRQKDNRSDQWVTHFVNALREELDATFKEEVSIYFDENPRDGLHDHHDVDDSLRRKLKCLIFIPIVSQTYCDENSFAWKHELQAFISQARNDTFGLKTEVRGGNVASRILPVRIHELEMEDVRMFESAVGGPMRAIDFVYEGAGVNRPLSQGDSPDQNLKKTFYKDQINKVANSLKQIIQGLQRQQLEPRQDENIEVPKSTVGALTHELDKRSVLRVGLVYIIVGLLVWKLAVILIETTSIPGTLLNYITILLIAFFPVALILAWLYERSPEGFIRVGSQNNPLSKSQRKPLTGNTYILSLLVAVLVLYFFFPQRSGMIQHSSLASSGEKSIAVLYFDNMTGSDENEYFSDGMTEEIITQLAKIEGLAVRGRNSVKRYKGEPLDIKKIANELGVTAILEGSVRRSGNQFRITAQLIDASNDEHIWAENYDRSSTNTIEIQASIAREIAKRFEIELTPESELKISYVPTKSEEAYNHYLQAKHIHLNNYMYIAKDEDFIRAKERYELAIKLDPDFAEAYAGLADLYDAFRNAKGSKNFPLLYPNEDSLRIYLANKAYQLNPNSSFVNYAKIWGHVNKSRWTEQDLDSGFFFLRRALELDNKDANNHFSLGGFYWGLGLYDQALQSYQKAVELDPFFHPPYMFMGQTHFFLGDLDRWHQYRAKSIELSGQEFSDLENVIWLTYGKKFTEAKEIVSELKKKNQSPSWLDAYVLASEGNRIQAQQIVKRDTITNIPVLLRAGLKKEALAAADSVIQFGRRVVFSTYQSMKRHPDWDPYRNDPEFKRVLAKAKALHDLYMRRYGDLEPTKGD